MGTHHLTVHEKSSVSIFAEQTNPLPTSIFGHFYISNKALKWMSTRIDYASRHQTNPFSLANQRGMVHVPSLFFST